MAQRSSVPLLCDLCVPPCACPERFSRRVSSVLWSFLCFLVAGHLFLLRPPFLVPQKRARQANHKQSQNGTDQYQDNQGPNLRSLYFRAGQPPIPALYFQLLTAINAKRASDFSDTRCPNSTPFSTFYSPARSRFPPYVLLKWIDPSPVRTTIGDPPPFIFPLILDELNVPSTVTGNPRLICPSCVLTSRLA
jgi:hypothetical protein